MCFGHTRPLSGQTSLKYQMCIMLYVDYLADSVEIYHIVYIIIKGVQPGSMLGLLYFTTYAKNY